MTEGEWIAEAKMSLGTGIRTLERHASWVKDPQEKTALQSAAHILQETLDKAPTAKEKAPSG